MAGSRVVGSVPYRLSTPLAGTLLVVGKLVGDMLLVVVLPVGVLPVLVGRIRGQPVSSSDITRIIGINRNIFFTVILTSFVIILSWLPYFYRSTIA